MQRHGLNLSLQRLGLNHDEAVSNISYHGTLIGDTMKQIAIIYIFLFSVIFCACNQPTGNNGPSFTGKLVLDGYGETVDSTYHKVWSDSSWEEFYQDTTINGVTYITILDAYGTEYLYDSLGYSGLQLYGYDAFMFDAPLPSLPDTVVGGQTYALLTTFTYQGTKFNFIDDETLVDTSTITVPFGTFASCPGIQSNNAIVSGGQAYFSSNTVYWLARGPSEIAQDLSDLGYSIFMVYGVVNGKGWGVSFGKVNAGGVPPSVGLFAPSQRAATSSSRTILDMHSLAPIIARGIIHGPRAGRF